MGSCKIPKLGETFRRYMTVIGDIWIKTWAYRLQNNISCGHVYDSRYDLVQLPIPCNNADVANE